MIVETIKSVASLLTSWGLLLFANGMFGTLLGVRTGIEGFSTEVVGFVMAGYFVGLLIGALRAVKVVATVGHIRAFAAFASIMSISALAHALIVDPIAWFFMRLVAGFCMAGMVMVTESWLNERATNEIRGQVLSMYMITNYLAAGLGQLALPLADPAKFHLFSVASIIFSLALVPVLLTQATAPMPSDTDRIRITELYKVSPLGFSATMCAGLVNAAFYSLGPIYATGIGLPLTRLSTFMASVILGGLLLQWPIGRLSDRIDRRWVMAGVGLATAAASIVVLAVPTGVGLYIAGAAYGGLSFTMYSIAAAHTNDFANPEKRVQTAGGLLIAYGIGASTGPILAAALMGQVGPKGLFLFSAAITGLLGGFAFYRMTQRDTRSKTRRFVFQPTSEFSSEELYTSVRDQMDRDLARMSGGIRTRY